MFLKKFCGVHPLDDRIIFDNTFLSIRNGMVSHVGEGGWSYPYFHFLSITAMQPHFYMNIVLTGGNALFQGYAERV